VADTADANGNLGSGVYDIENRLIQPAGTSVTYAYAPGNKRVWRFSQAQFDEFTFWGANGQKLGTYNLQTVSGVTAFVRTSTNVYFGGRLVAKVNSTSSLVAVGADRLGSIGTYYPYGQQRSDLLMEPRNSPGISGMRKLVSIMPISDIIRRVMEDS